MFFFLLCVVRAMCVDICLRFIFRCGEALFGWAGMYSGGGGNQDSDVSSETVVLPVITTSGLKNIHTHTIEYTLVCVHMH